MKCLIVDDLEENLLALGALLQGPQVQVLQARSGRAALELLLEHDVAVALVDVQMPEMDGFELAELMRGTERTRQVPIIFVTAGAHEPHRVFQGYELGAVDFLYKPIDPLILKSKVNVFFQLYRQREQLAEQLQKLGETLRMNEMFTAILSHDLRNPLNAVLTGAELLLRTTQDEATRKVSERIRSSGQRMAGLVADILDLARWRVGAGISLSLQAVNLAELVERVVAEHQPNPDQPRILLELSGDLQGHWDPRRLEQALSNLLGNAVQHGQDGEPVRLKVSGSAAELVTVHISNSGRMPESVRARLFDPFRAGDRNGGHPERGLGLGLYIAQQVVLAHGGSIELEDDDAERTTFRVDLPRRSTS
jgi:two-component system, sensor histidine kinase and response regulator